jgi:3,5-epimerase/4-reductase
MVLPKVIVFGANGWIGSKVCNLLKEMNTPFISAVSRADNYEDVKTEVKQHKVTHIMSFIGRTHGVYEDKAIGTIDYLEKPGKLVENLRDNLYGPLVLANIAKELNIHFTYLGTGCIFDYDENHPMNNTNSGFTETDDPNFFGSSYSITKGYTDKIMRTLYEKNVLNVRIRMPITDEFHPRNFITKITLYEKVCSIPNSMTVLNDLLPAMLDLAFANQVGTINLTNPGVISHNEILEMYKEIVDPSFTWKNFSIEEQNQVLSSKRSNNYLNTELLERLHCVKPIKDAVRDVLVKMAETYKEKIDFLV